MGIFEGLWLVARGAVKIGMVVAKAAIAVVGWAIAHPVLAIVVGIALIGGAALLRAQPWAGADVVADALHWTGKQIGLIGIGAWITKAIIASLPTVGEKVLQFLKYLLRIPSGSTSSLEIIYQPRALHF